jgi:hypothetical protein
MFNDLAVLEAEQVAPVRRNVRRLRIWNAAGLSLRPRVCGRLLCRRQASSLFRWQKFIPARPSARLESCCTNNLAKRAGRAIVQLFDGNQQLAINAVNSGEHNPSACAVIDVAYVPGTALGVARSRSYRDHSDRGGRHNHATRISAGQTGSFFHARKSQGICGVNNREPTPADEGFQRTF